MDNNIISTSKITSTTPFSINDILTKNNTTLFRRTTTEKTTLICGQSNDRECEDRKQFLNIAQRKSAERKFIANGQLENHKNSEHFTSQYYNNNSVCAPNFNANRRKSLDCFLIDNEMSKERLSDCERYTSEKLGNFDNKSRFCGYGVGEIPLDMRRCNSNDSGRFFFINIEK